VSYAVIFNMLNMLTATMIHTYCLPATTRRTTLHYGVMVWHWQVLQHTDHQQVLR